MDGQVRTQKEFEQERNTHSLKSVDRQTSQDMERIQASEGHSPTGEQRWTDKSEHGKNPTEQGALTNWRVQMDGQVSTQKESKQVRGTHSLKNADRQTSQDMERIEASEGHSQTREHRWMDKSGHGKNQSK